jgi:hypothetical protein
MGVGFIERRLSLLIFFFIFFVGFPENIFLEIKTTVNILWYWPVIFYKNLLVIQSGKDISKLIYRLYRSNMPVYRCIFVESALFIIVHYFNKTNARKDIITLISEMFLLSDLLHKSVEQKQISVPRTLLHFSSNGIPKLSIQCLSTSVQKRIKFIYYLVKFNPYNS